MKKISNQDICSKCGGKDIEKYFIEKGAYCRNNVGKFAEYYLRTSSPWSNDFIRFTPSICKGGYLTDAIGCMCSCGYTWEVLPLDSKLKEKDILKQVQESKVKAEKELEEYLEQQKKIEANAKALKEALIDEKYDNLIEELDKESKRLKHKKPFWCKWFCK